LKKLVKNTFDSDKKSWYYNLNGVWQNCVNPVDSHSPLFLCTPIPEFIREHRIASHGEEGPGGGCASILLNLMIPMPMKVWSKRAAKKRHKTSSFGGALYFFVRR